MNNLFTFQNRMNNIIEYIRAFNLQEANQQLEKLHPSCYKDFILVGTIESV
ncbi:MAG: hypothetical protein RBR23_09940 [Arcobacteraceae bacterium]|jgi:hypothetical protein|nr:hypothetical protein [Arcobacteraceae bacterium]